MEVTRRSGSLGEARKTNVRTPDKIEVIMSAVIADPDLERSLIRRRRARGEDRYDEVWEGVYVMNAQPTNVPQSLVSRLSFVFESVIGQLGLGMVLPGTNVSDRAESWKKNYRCPDVAVYLNESKAINWETHWQGGPDLAVEIASPRDARGRRSSSTRASARANFSSLIVIRGPSNSIA